MMQIPYQNSKPTAPYLPLETYGVGIANLANQ